MEHYKTIEKEKKFWTEKKIIYLLIAMAFCVVVAYANMSGGKQPYLSIYGDKFSGSYDAQGYNLLNVGDFNATNGNFNELSVDSVSVCRQNGFGCPPGGGSGGARDILIDADGDNMTGNLNMSFHNITEANNISAFLLNSSYANITHLSVAPDTDEEAFIGRWRLGYIDPLANYACAAHTDMFNINGFAICQDNGG